MKAQTSTNLNQLARQLSQGVSLSRYKDDEGEIEALIVNGRNLERLYVSGEIEKVRLKIPDVERYELQVNDIVINNRSTPLRASVIPLNMAGYLAGQNLVVLRPEQIVNPVYLAIVLRSQWMEHLLARLYSSSISTKLISISDLSSLEIPLPNLETQQKIAQLFLAAEQAEQAAIEAISTRQKLLEFTLEQMIEAR